MFFLYLKGSTEKWNKHSWVFDIIVSGDIYVRSKENAGTISQLNSTPTQVVGWTTHPLVTVAYTLKLICTSVNLVFSSHMSAMSSYYNWKTIRGSSAFCDINLIYFCNISTPKDHSLGNRKGEKGKGVIYSVFLYSISMPKGSPCTTLKPMQTIVEWGGKWL